jgi:CelD/BcsL family acetyltransferase involved in cellulose biosynthesis
MAHLRYDVFLGDLTPADSEWGATIRARTLKKTGYPILRFDGVSWEDYLLTRTSNFRQNLGRRPRKLQRSHNVAFRLASDPARLDSDLDVLFALHRARFQNHGGCLFCGSAEAFQRRFAATALERGWLRLWILEVDGKPVAANYGFRLEGVESYYQSGRDPAWDWASVGFILHAHVIRGACDDGVSEYRFLEGEETYKYRYTDEDPGLVTIALAGSAAGRVALAGAHTLRRLPPVVALWERGER